MFERVTFVQLTDYLSANKLHDIKQSAYRKLFSTETAQLKTSNDIFLKLAKGTETAVIAPEITTACEIIDHELWLLLLKNNAGFKISASKDHHSSVVEYLSR